MKLLYQNMTIFFDFQTTSNHLHSLQVENCDSNSRLVVDEDDNGKLRLERVKMLIVSIAVFNLSVYLQLHGDRKVFSIRNYHKSLSLLFPLHLNTYVLGLRPLYLFLFFSVRGPSFEVKIWRLQTVPRLKMLRNLCLSVSRNKYKWLPITLFSIFRGVFMLLIKLIIILYKFEKSW